MRTKQLIKGVAVAAVGALMTLSVQAAEFTGAGATFPFPIYSKWAEAYKASTGIGLNYQSIGSGGGMAAGGMVMTGAGTVVGGGDGGDRAIVDGVTVAASAVDDTTPPHPANDSTPSVDSATSTITKRRSKVSALTCTVRRKIVSNRERNGDTRRSSVLFGNFEPDRERVLVAARQRQRLVRMRHEAGPHEQ